VPDLLRHLRDYKRALDLGVRGGVLLGEVAQLPIARSGVVKREGMPIPFVELDDGTLLHGGFPTAAERRLHRAVRRRLPAALVQDAFQVAVDAVTRYCYPHAMPQLTPPGPPAARRGFHPQHRQTIDDLAGLSEAERTELRSLFTVRPGEVLLDVGSYIGFGAVRFAQEAGPEGRVAALEADPSSHPILRANVATNVHGRVTIVPRAAWLRSGERKTLHTTRRQSNSLVESVSGSAATVEVPTVALDDLVTELGLVRVDVISLTINGGEPEALEGAAGLLRGMRPLRVVAAGWYRRDGTTVGALATPLLRAAGLRVHHDRGGVVLAWSAEGAG
jgi:FkbM family methyltransferase